jgi:enolase
MRLSAICSMRRSESLAKYNQLLRIAEDPKMRIAGMAAYPHHQ